MMVLYWCFCLVLLPFASSRNVCPTIAMSMRCLFTQQWCVPQFCLVADPLTVVSCQSAAEQKRAFEPAPHGKTKVLLSTNIAETSLTLNDVVYVIDGGRENEMQYDAVRRTSALVETWVAQASAQQRRGRAGNRRPAVATRFTLCLQVVCAPVIACDSTRNNTFDTFRRSQRQKLPAFRCINCVCRF